ncbi:MAG: long-chain fatty acid--CoA ligase [Desulfobacteraceae bacterium]|jgi:long-chain acyl-CoA synthetase|nr:MAG: long-chain fatty acid--CoA ligase [Desulfobacteraceae bacterium]
MDVEYKRKDTIPSLFLSQVKKHAKRVALREKNFGIWDEISWSGYYQKVNHLALGCLSLGMEKGDRVAILSENRQEWLYSDLAAQSIGGISVGIYPTNPPFQVKYILEHSGANLCIVEDQEQTDKVLEIKNELRDLKKIIVVDPKGLRNYKDPMLMVFDDLLELGKEMDQKTPGLLIGHIAEIQENDVATMVYTSGTTGPPKGVMWTHKSILAVMDDIVTMLPLTERDEVVSYLPLSHGAERYFSLYAAIMAGYTVSFSESITTIQEALAEISPTFFFAVPRIWEKMYSQIHAKVKDSVALKRYFFELSVKIGQRLTQRIINQEEISLGSKILYGLAYILCLRAIRDKLGLLRARTCLSAAAPISPEILKFFHSIGIVIRQGYGMTETGGFNFLQRKSDFKPGSVGKALPATEKSKIADDGELLVKGKCLFLKYFKDPDATAKMLQGGWAHTGDVAKVDEEGDLFIVDRKKDLIITSGGKNIAPSEIENDLKRSLFISEAVIIGDNRKFLSALIQINFDNVSKWAMENRISFTNYKSLAVNPEVYKLIQNEVKQVNSRFSRVENVRKFRIFDKELDEDDNEVTATQKVKRAIIENKFKYLIDDIYTE